MFVTFEGIDGVGKSTQLVRFAEQLKQDGHGVFCTREPGGGGDIGRTIRELLKSSTQSDALTELMLIYGARRHHIKLEIEPALQRGEMVLCDRYFDSSVAFLAREGDVIAVLQKVQTLHELSDCKLMPDITFLFDLDADMAYERVLQRSASDNHVTQADKYQNFSKAQVNIIRNNFLTLSELFSQRIVVVDASQSIVDIEQALWQKWLTFKR